MNFLGVRLDPLLVFLSIGATLIGVFTLYGGSPAGEALAIRKLIWLILGIALMLYFATVNYQTIGAYAPVIYLAGVFLLAITLVPFLGTKVKGARSWLRIAGFGFQPAEFMKLALVIALGKYLVIREAEIGKLKELLIPVLIALVPTGLIALQPDLGSSVLFLALTFTMLFIGGANASVIVGAAVVGLMVLFVPMYLEYHKYILVDSIFALLKDVQVQAADAVRTLNFEVWQFVENPDVPLPADISPALKISAETLREPGQQKVFWEAVAEAEKANPSFFRDFFRSDLAMIIIISVSLVMYLMSLLGLFLTRSAVLRPLSTLSLIIFLGFGSSYLFRKVVSFKPHQVIRVVSFANPDKFPKGAGYQLRHSLITVGSGQFTGKGMFRGDMTRGETPFLPEWHNDFAFSVVGEQFGFLGTSLLLLILFGIVFRGFSIALSSKDDFGGVLAGGISVIFLYHIVINIGIAVGLLPVTGLPLIFVSDGGSNLTMCFIGIGILLNINGRRFINA